MTAAVGGPAATLQDFDGAATSRLWPLVLLLVCVTYLVLVPILRSLVLPLLAVLLNVLTVAAAFGVLTLGFEGAAPLGGSGQLDAIMVLAIFGIVFALSIDYEVFLLARIREGYALTGTTEGAIDYGLRRTAGVITGAAMIMTGVFVAFAMSDIASMRQLGVGLTVAVLLDATLVRLVLLPAAIRLAGRANWWLPRTLDRLLPRIDVEGPVTQQPAVFANGNPPSRGAGGKATRDQVADAVARFVGTRRDRVGR
jgi:RND superfamily putative drug exporter